MARLETLYSQDSHATSFDACIEYSREVVNIGIVYKLIDSFKGETLLEESFLKIKENRLLSEKASIERLFGGI